MDDSPFLLSDPEGAAAFAKVSNYTNSKHRDVKSSLTGCVKVNPPLPTRFLLLLSEE